MINKKILQNAQKIFQTGSKTYFNSANFFPDDIRNDVFILYSFVRTADDYIDQKNPQQQKFLQFKQQFCDRLKGHKANDLIIDPFFELIQKKQIETDLPLKFLSAMEQDLTKNTYETLEELIEYMEGSAEVIGLIMAKIMNLPPKSYPAAKMLGRSMQFINFIRDINHDLGLNRIYLPQKVLKKYNLSSLEYQITSTNPDQFIQCLNDQIKLYFDWQKEAEKGFNFIPKPYLIPIKTASDMYKWTAAQILKDPFIVYKKRLKPTKSKILTTIKENQNI